ncbi:MAG TPA: hypothetical protein VNQ79_05325 [Blastocatellia bacterium]|nr:hypothetical protein [Blastocatellia bacterium]
MLTIAERTALTARLGQIARECLTARARRDWQLAALLRAEAREIATRLAQADFRQRRESLSQMKGH